MMQHVYEKFIQLIDDVGRLTLLSLMTHVYDNTKANETYNQNVSYHMLKCYVPAGFYPRSDTT